jgi:hypothetical protein
MGWLANLYSVLVSVAGQPVPQRVRQDFSGPGAPTVTDNPAKDRTDFYFPGTPASGAFGNTTISLGPGTPPQWQLFPPVTIVTTDGTNEPLWSYALPPDRRSVPGVYVFAWIKTAATAFRYSNYFFADLYRIGTGAPGGIGTGGWNPGGVAPFSMTAGDPGALDVGISGNVLTIYAKGIGAPSAWSAGVKTVGQLETNAGNVYIVVSVSGTGTSTTAPAGTGAGIIDNPGANQVVRDFLAAGTAVPITWTAVEPKVWTT